MKKRLRLLPVCALLVASSLACGPSRHVSSRSSRSHSARAERIETKIDQLVAGQQITHDLLEELLGLARSQGSGEITLFFGPGDTSLRKGSDEHDRLVRFLDQLVVQSAGRKIVLVSIGTASAPGGIDTNEKLSLRRAQNTAAEIDHYLINHPHKVRLIKGTGSRNSPTQAGWRINRRYRSVRLIAVFESPETDTPS